MEIQTPKETIYEIKAKRYIFSLASDIDAKKSYFSCRVKIPYQQFEMLLNFHHSHWFHEHFQKQPFAGVL